jgi:hypothetical protein
MAIKNIPLSSLETDLKKPLLLAGALLSCVALLGADEPPNTPPSRIVGRVFGKAMTAADIGLTAPIDPAVKFDARDTAQWELMGRILKTFGSPVVERFVKQQKIEATTGEIARFKSNSRKMDERNVREWKARLAELKQQLATTSLSNEDKAKLKEEQTLYEKLLASRRDTPAADVPDELARMFIRTWKTERELHRVYGGRVIFQHA